LFYARPDGILGHGEITSYFLIGFSTVAEMLDNCKIDFIDVHVSAIGIRKQKGLSISEIIYIKFDDSVN
jgi:hypothetical protein